MKTSEKARAAQKRYQERLKREGIPDYIQERRARNQRESRARIKSQIFLLLGDSCKNCGFSDKRALQIDHINGHGTKQREFVKGSSLYRQILKEIRAGSQEYQILCANCNWIKRFENNENPGQQKYKY